METPPTSPSPAPSPPQRAAPQEVLRDYGVATVLLLAWEIWCIRDGWFHPGYEHITFSRIMAIISAPVLIFCAVMAISAWLTLRRNRRSQSPS